MDPVYLRQEITRINARIKQIEHEYLDARYMVRPRLAREKRQLEDLRTRINDYLAPGAPLSEQEIEAALIAVSTQSVASEAPLAAYPSDRASQLVLPLDLSTPTPSRDPHAITDADSAPRKQRRRPDPAATQ